MSGFDGEDFNTATSRQIGWTISLRGWLCYHHLRGPQLALQALVGGVPLGWHDLPAWFRLLLWVTFWPLLGWRMEKGETSP